MAEEDINFKLTADVSDIAKGLKQVQKDLAKLGDESDDTTKDMTGLQKAMSKLAAASKSIAKNLKLISTRLLTVGKQAAKVTKELGKIAAVRLGGTLTSIAKIGAGAFASISAALAAAGASFDRTEKSAAALGVTIEELSGTGVGIALSGGQERDATRLFSRLSEQRKELNDLVDQLKESSLDEVAAVSGQIASTPLLKFQNQLNRLLEEANLERINFLDTQTQEVKNIVQIRDEIGKAFTALRRDNPSAELSGLLATIGIGEEERVGIVNYLSDLENVQAEVAKIPGAIDSPDVAKAAANLSDELLKVLKGFRRNLGDALLLSEPAITDFLQSIAKASDDNAQTISETVSNVYSRILSFLTDVVNLINGNFEAINPDGLIAGFVGVRDAIRQVFVEGQQLETENPFSWLNTVKAALDTIYQLFVDIGTVIASVINPEGIKLTANQQELKNTFIEVKDAVVEIARALTSIAGVIAPTINATAQASESLKNFSSPVLKGLSDLINIPIGGGQEIAGALTGNQALIDQGALNRAAGLDSLFDTNLRSRVFQGISEREATSNVNIQVNGQQVGTVSGGETLDVNINRELRRGTVGGRR